MPAKVTIEYTENELKELIQRDIEERTNQQVDLSDIKIETKSKPKKMMKMNDPEVLEKVKTITLRQLLANLDNDIKEDGDTGVHLEMTLEEYLKNLYS